MGRQQGGGALMLPSWRTNPDAQTTDLAGYGIPCVLQLGSAGCAPHAAPRMAPIATTASRSPSARTAA